MNGVRASLLYESTVYKYWQFAIVGKIITFYFLCVGEICIFADVVMGDILSEYLF